MMNRYIYFLIATTIFPVFLFGQVQPETYGNASAKAELKSIIRKMNSSEPFELDPQLFRYIHEHIRDFPEMDTDAEQQLENINLLTVYIQLNRIQKYLYEPEKKDSITYVQAVTMASLGHMSTRLLSYTKQFMKTVDKKDPSYETRKRGFDQSVMGMRQFVVGYLTVTFIENRNREINGLLIDNAMVFSPKLLKEMPKEDRKNTRKKIEETIFPKVNEGLRETFNVLLENI
jgi:hypothetical protein